MEVLGFVTEALKLATSMGDHEKALDKWARRIAAGRGQGCGRGGAGRGRGGRGHGRAGAGDGHVGAPPADDHDRPADEDGIENHSEEEMHAEADPDAPGEFEPWEEGVMPPVEDDGGTQVGGEGSPMAPDGGLALGGSGIADGGLALDDGLALGSGSAVGGEPVDGLADGGGGLRPDGGLAPDGGGGLRPGAHERPADGGLAPGGGGGGGAVGGGAVGGEPVDGLADGGGGLRPDGGLAPDGGGGLGPDAHEGPADGGLAPGGGGGGAVGGGADGGEPVDGMAIAQRVSRAGPDGWPRCWRRSGLSLRLSRNVDGSIDFRAMCPCGGSRSGTCKSNIMEGEAVDRATVKVCQGRPFGKCFAYILYGEELGEGHSKEEHALCPNDLATRSNARSVGEGDSFGSSPNAWYPRYRADWNSFIDLERPRHPVLDDEHGEPLLSRL